MTKLAGVTQLQSGVIITKDAAGLASDMTESAQGDVEILVHISAPSRGKDDAHYRELAAAYLAFEPLRSKSNNENTSEAVSLNVDQEAEGQLRAELWDSQHEEQAETTVYDEGEDSYSESEFQAQDSFRKTYLTRSHIHGSLESPHASFNSILDNADSPALQTQHQVSGLRPEILPDLEDTREDGWRTPPSEVEDSQSQGFCPIPHLSSPTRVLELFLQQFPSSDVALEDTTVSVNEGSHGQNGSSSVGGISSSQRILHTYKPTSPIALVVESAQSKPAEGDGPLIPQKRKASTSESPRTPTNPITLAVSSTTKTCSTQIVPATVFPMSKTDLRSQGPQPGSSPSPSILFMNSNEIYPPRPPTSSSNLRPSDLLTPSLSTLALRLDLPTRFRPKTQVRDLRAFERGHWRLSTESWGEGMKGDELRGRAWNALGMYVQKGRAGWGVWVSREDKESCTGEWRVYCWGNIVGHIYLLLYLVSERRVKNTGARWVDGGGNVVVVMEDG